MNSLLHKNNSDSNTAMLHTKAKPFVQAKLTVNTPGDIYEQEADAMADRVMRMSPDETAKPVTGLIGRSVQRKCAHCEEEEKRKKPIMRKAEAGNAGMSVSSSFAASLNASKGGGSPLPQGTRSFMENAFSADFSRVRVHKDTEASEMNKGINAKAFTYGSDIYFNQGQFNLDSSEGKHLLAHELAHTMQQRGVQSEMVQRACVSGNWQHEFDGCSLPSWIAVILGIDRNNPAGGSDTQFGSNTGRNMNRPCDTHDICYQTCGSNRGICDVTMLRDMHAVCNNSTESRALKDECRDWANRTYAGLIQYGESAYDERQEQTCSCKRP